MELKAVKESDDTLLLEVKGESVTVTNVVTGELWNDENVKEAAHIKEHPYLEEPKIFVKVSKGKPVTALDKAAERVIKQTEEFSEAFKKAVKA
ncbi:MAG: RpoL/Rpb11 RNA polymerase subunit family protein [Candidatus Aenigmatarchaeota archaeon]